MGGGFLFLSPLAFNIGIICVVVQLFLTFLLRMIPCNGPWTSAAGFTAHQIVALPLMIILTCYGWSDWFFNADKDVFSSSSSLSSSAAYHRIFGMNGEIESSCDNDLLVSIALGAILLWDTPCGMFIPELRDPIMFLHHVGMGLVAAATGGLFSGGVAIGYYYSSFFFGVIEFSSIFLIAVDMFHPKNKYWHEWLSHNDHKDSSALKAIKKFTREVNEIVRVLFAIAFLLLRGIYFPCLSFFKVIPDLKEAYYGQQSPPQGVPFWTCHLMGGLLILFACLQAYWALLIAKQVRKVLLGGDQKKKS